MFRHFSIHHHRTTGGRVSGGSNVTDLPSIRLRAPMIVIMMHAKLLEISDCVINLYLKGLP